MALSYHLFNILSWLCIFLKQYCSWCIVWDYVHCCDVKHVLSTIMLGTVMLGTVMLGTVMLGTVTVGTLMQGTVTLGTVMLSTVILC